MAQTQVAFLRGINVGGKNKLPMVELRTLFEALGATEVRSYIQSGNVVFSLPSRELKTFAERAVKAILDRHRLQVPLVVRSAEELDHAIAANPFLKRGIAPDLLHVMFLSALPGANAKPLDPQRSPTDSFELLGREVYLHCPQGLGRSKLTNEYFDRALGTVSTCRNWRTVLALQQLAR